MNTLPKIRKIVTVDAHLAVLPTREHGEDFRTFIADIMHEFHTQYLLAHADDGVIWGQLVEGTLAIARDEAQHHDKSRERQQLLNVCASLDPHTIWEVRLFGENAMVQLWRSSGAGQWGMTVMQDGNISFVNDTEYVSLTSYSDMIEEQQLLWGERDACYKLPNFTVMRDGKQGLVHVVPIAVPDNHRVQLKVRHYLLEDEATGFVRMAASRLVGFEIRRSDTNE